MRRGYVVSPQEILRRSLTSGLITIPEALSYKFRQAAKYTADDLRSYWPEGEGYGSSDFTATLESFLREAGCETHYVNHRLERKDRQREPIDLSGWSRLQGQE